MTDLNRSRLIGIALAFVSGILFAFLPAFFRFANSAGATVITVLSVRCMVAAVILWLVVLRQGDYKLPANRVAGFALMGGLYIFENVLYLLSIQLIPIATASILLYLYPAIVTLLARLFLRESLDPRKIAALILALGGATLVIGKPQAASDWLGVVLAVLCSTIYSCYIVIASKLQRGVPAQTTTAYVLAAAGLLGLGYGVMSGQFQLNLGSSALLPILTLSLFFTAPPILALFESVRRVGASTASIVSTVEPVATAMLGLLLFGEQLGVPQILGGALVIFAIVLLSTGR